MPISRLRALSACSKSAAFLRRLVQAGEVQLEREGAAVGIEQHRAGRLQVREELEDERAGKPYGVERIDAAHVERLLLQRRDADPADRAAIRLPLGRSD